MEIAANTKQFFTTIASNKNQLVILLLGFSSGLPAALTASTLQAWFTNAGLSLQTIGAVTLLVLPYTFRFLWAPLLDYWHPPGMDRRRSWLLLTQVGLIFSIAAMALLTPEKVFSFHQWTIPWLMLVGFITAFLSTSQDIVINAYQVEILPQTERGLGAALYVTGWRIGAIISGALGLVLAAAFGWKDTYLIMASLMGVGIIATTIAAQSPVTSPTSTTLFHAMVTPFKDFFQRFGMKISLLFLLIIITYKAGEALTLALNTTFLLREVGFDLATVGIVNKTVSLAAALLGGLTAGYFMTRWSLYRALLIFGIFQGCANLGYALLAYCGKSLSLLILTAFAENFCSGMGTIALLAFIMTLCNTKYTATQFALLSALAFVARTVVGPVAATMVESIGWFTFFIWCFLLSLPTLLLILSGKTMIENLKS